MSVQCWTNSLKTSKCIQNKDTMKKLIIIAYIFRLSCLLIFLYQAWLSFVGFSEKKTFSDQKFVRQEMYPLPLICITTEEFHYSSFNNTFQITNDEYVEGKWKVDGLTERELWDFLSPKLPDLIEKVVIYKTLRNDSDTYSKQKISVDDLPGFGVQIERKDYHSNPRIFCLLFRNYVFRKYVYLYNVFSPILGKILFHLAFRR